MIPDLQSAQIAVTIVGGLLAILGIVFGWFGKAYRWIASKVRPKPSPGIIEVPSKIMIIMPLAQSKALWWHMGGMNGHPAMQIVGDLSVTNISHYGLYIMGSKLRRPKAVGHALVQGESGYGIGNLIPERAVTNLRFDFYVQPPVCAAGKAFKADVAVIDQFGNEHWLKGLTFPYV